LTGAWNRRFLEHNFRRIIEGFRQRDARIHFAVLDIDNFKGTNDRHGHHHGDVVLRQFVRVFHERLGEDGYMIRLGGDEFALLYCGDDIDAVMSASLAALDDDTGLGAVTASVGVVRIGIGGAMVLDSIYRRADQALYSEKRRRERRPPPDESPPDLTTTIGETA
ncbi:MAG: GGDEF domain-containing protein, partial [Gammaproteobacteria bacterium]